MENFQLPHYYPLSILLRIAFRIVENCSLRQTNVGWVRPPKEYEARQWYTRQNCRTHHKKTKASICLTMRIVNIIRHVVWAVLLVCDGIDRINLYKDIKCDFGCTATLDGIHAGIFTHIEWTKPRAHTHKISNGNNVGLIMVYNLSYVWNTLRYNICVYVHVWFQWIATPFHIHMENVLQISAIFHFGYTDFLVFVNVFMCLCNSR